MTLGGGDSLARGARRADFSVGNVTQKEWELIFGEGAKKPNIMSEEQRLTLEAVEAELRKQVDADIAANPVAEIKFRAVQDRIIVRRVEAETKIGSILIADDSKEKPYEGIVVAVGPGRYIGTQFVPVSVQKGERVVFGKYSGAEVKLGYEDFLVLREDDLFLIKE